jgi:hypothetical protein
LTAFAEEIATCQSRNQARFTRPQRLHHQSTRQLKYITWPDENERKTIAKRIEKKFFLPNAVSLMDGTLLPLGIAPSCDDAADYHGRKYAYSLTVNVINDGHRVLIWLVSPAVPMTTECGKT